MNILIIGNCSKDFIFFIKKSRLLNKIYLAQNLFEDNLPKIEFSSFEELAQKIRSLQIDITIITDKNYIKDGMVDYLKSKFINVISPNKKWFNLENSRLAAKQLLKHYHIATPEILLAPKSFPIVIKTDSPTCNKIIKSMQELINTMAEISGEKNFLEEYQEGEHYSLLTLWDGKSVAYFIEQSSLTEVQKERLDFLKAKLNILFSEESPDFLGFFTIKLIWTKNDWQILDFDMYTDTELIAQNVNMDFLYLLNTVIYQKINELP